MYVYAVITVKDNQIESISKEGYTTLLKAQEFIESRSDNPRKRTEFIYLTDERNYQIIEIKVV